MTVLLYQTDSYLQEFEATVLSVDEANHAILLDQTAFYPGGGGQPCDTGWLSIASEIKNVIKTRKSGEDVFHYMDPTESLPTPGTKVNGRINWDHRYSLMRTHTALHILCGVVFRDYGALVTGGDMSPFEGRMDFEFETLQKELVQEIENAVNQEVQKNLPVRVAILPRAEAFQIPDLIRTKINLLPEGIQQVRVVEIVGLDLQADGGTHVRSTGEVGKVKVVDYKSKGRINKRIYITLQRENKL